jgi:hypothetical protein
MSNRLTKKEINDFRDFYLEILLFSYINRLEVEEYYIYDIANFITNERSFFYKNRHSIIRDYIKAKGTLKSYKKFLKAIEKGIYDDFYLVSYSSHSAILADSSYRFYLVNPYDESFDKLFSSVKNMEYPIVRTTIIPYKDRYIIDGVLPMHESHSLTKKILKRFIKKDSPKPKNSSSVISIPVHINIFVHSFEDSHYDKLEHSLMNISENFTKGLLPIFDEKFIDNVSFLSSFISPFSLLEEDEDEFFEKLDGIKDNFNRLNVTNFYKFKKVYNKKKSQKAKDNTKMFYTLCGVIEIEEDKEDDFDRLIYKINRDKKIREKITIGIENLFMEINKKDNLEIDPIFIGVSNYDFENMYESLNHFIKFIKLTKHSIELMKYYSIHRNKVIGQTFKLLFNTIFKKSEK